MGRSSSRRPTCGPALSTWITLKWRSQAPPAKSSGRQFLLRRKRFTALTTESRPTSAARALSASDISVPTATCFELAFKSSAKMRRASQPSSTAQSMNAATRRTLCARGPSARSFMTSTPSPPPLSRAEISSILSAQAPAPASRSAPAAPARPLAPPSPSPKRSERRSKTSEARVLKTESSSLTRSRKFFDRSASGVSVCDDSDTSDSSSDLTASAPAFSVFAARVSLSSASARRTPSERASILLRMRFRSLSCAARSLRRFQVRSIAPWPALSVSRASCVSPSSMPRKTPRLACASRSSSSAIDLVASIFSVMPSPRPRPSLGVSAFAACACTLEMSACTRSSPALRSARTSVSAMALRKLCSSDAAFSSASAFASAAASAAAGASAPASSAASIDDGVRAFSTAPAALACACLLNALRSTSPRRSAAAASASLWRLAIFSPMMRRIAGRVSRSIVSTA
mmetsp:Transcript_14054/g.41936  ORF Transcript_14054/g.41936 Transcript_14054/m.41936 type:complete len:460 (-) Transcript_14054:1054-2433(-)